MLGDKVAVDRDANVDRILLYLVKRLRSAFGPEEKRENSSYFR